MSSFDALAQKQKKFCAPAPPSPYKHTGQIVTSFDGSAGGMKTALQHPVPLAGSQATVYLGAAFVHRDPRSTAPATFQLALLATSLNVERFRAAHDVVITADGRPVPAGRAADYRTRAGGQGTVVEMMTVTLSLDELSSLTSARRVTARVGGEELMLTDNHLEALREFASFVGGSPKKGWRTE